MTQARAAPATYIARILVSAHWQNGKKNNVSTQLEDKGSDEASWPRAERRRSDRRRGVLRGLLRGNLSPRRRLPRRDGERAVTALDWHHPQWLAVAVVIVALSCTDAFLTLMLLEHGAYEANPLMAPLVAGSALRFAVVKILLTAFGVVLLTLLARLRAFGVVPVGLLLYTLLALYGALIVHELRLLNAG